MGHNGWMSQHQPSSPPAPSGLVGGAALLLTLGGVALWLLMLSGPVQLGTGLLEARFHLDQAQKELTAGTFRPAVFDTFSARAGAAKALRGLEAAGPLMDLATLSDSVDGLLGELDHIVVGTAHATDAAGGTLDIGLNALKGPDRIIGKSPDGEGSIILIERVEDLGEVVEQVRSDVNAAADEFSKVRLANLPKRLRAPISDGIEQARASDEVLGDAEAGIELLPGILGADEPRTYMLAFQNSAELRGAGGAMLQFEFLTIDDGKPELASDKTGSIYKLDQEREPIDIPLPKDAWYVRGLSDAQRFGNSNWSPDWPLSARLAVDYGERSSQRCVPTGERSCPDFPDVDGVFALDPVVIEDLMSGIGPFRRGPYQFRTITAVHLLLNRAYQRFPIPAHRRNFLGNVVSDLFTKMFDPKAPTRLVQGMGTSLANKNMQIWMSDAEEQAFIERMKWDGGISEIESGDYFQVVEQNVGGNKLDYFASQINKMDVTIDGEDAIHSTSVGISNDVVQPQPRWVLGDSKTAHRPMLNFYVPPGAELMTARAGRLCPVPLDRSCNGRIDTPPGLATWSGAIPPTHRERGKKVWSATLQIPPRERGSFSVDYRSPDVLEQRGDRTVYRLMVQRQAKFHPEELLIKLRLPAEARKIQAPGFKKEGSTLTYERPLKTDTVVEVSWRS